MKDFIMMVLEEIEFNSILFRVLPDWPEYAVSYCGEVLVIGNSKSKTSKILKKDCSSGYPRVGVGSKENRKKMSVHRLVAIMWVVNPYNKPIVNHKDRDTLNCNASNLEWCDHSENRYHGYHKLRTIEEIPQIKNEKYIALRKINKNIDKFNIKYGTNYQNLQ